MEAIMTELVLSGEVERSYRLLREIGFVEQMEFHSPTSQYGQLSRRGRFDHLDVARTMHELADDIASGKFADEWDREGEKGYARLKELKEVHCGEGIRNMEHEMRRVLGPKAGSGPSSDQS
jgi:ketol-acid reductoisomerase